MYLIINKTDKSFYFADKLYGELPSDNVAIIDYNKPNSLDNYVVNNSNDGIVIDETIALEQAEATQKAEAQKYLSDTDFYMTIDKYATLTDLKKAELTMLRANARDVINGVVSEPAVTIPTVVTKEQGILALSQAGLLTTIEATIANSGDQAIIDEWANATELRRDCVSLIALCQILGITDEQLDNLFLSASVL